MYQLDNNGFFDQLNKNLEAEKTKYVFPNVNATPRRSVPGAIGAVLTFFGVIGVGVVFIVLTLVLTMLVAIQFFIM